ncbi:unnamed protein product, partial [Effrenium voratum]
MASPRSLKKRTLRIGDLGKQQQWQMAVQVMEDLRRELLQPSIFTYSALATACSRGLQWQATLQLLREMQLEKLRPDAHFLAVVISGCGRGTEWPKSLELFSELKVSQILPSRASYNAAMDACSRGEQWEAVIHMQSCMKQQNVEPDRVTAATCIDALGRQYFWQCSLQLFDQMQGQMHPDLISATSIITACGLGRQWEISLRMLADMPLYDLRPNVATFGAAIAACARGLQWPEAVELLREMEFARCSPNGIAVGAAIVACQRSMHWNQAAELLQSYKVSSGEGMRELAKVRMVGDTAAMKARVNAADWAGALQIFTEMQRAAMHLGPKVRMKKGLISWRRDRPDRRALSTALEIFSISAHWVSALATLQHMVQHSMHDAADVEQTAAACQLHGKMQAFSSLMRASGTAGAGAGAWSYKPRRMSTTRLDWRRRISSATVRAAFALI